MYAGIIDSMYYLDIKDERWKPMIKKFATGISVGVCLCILGAIAFIFAAASEKYHEKATLVLSLSMAGGFAIIAAAVVLFVIHGLKFSSGVKDIAPEYITSQTEPHTGVGRFGGVVMLLATAIFLVLGFVFGKWHPGWVVFPIGGIICAILGAVDEATGKGKKGK